METKKFVYKHNKISCDPIKILIYLTTLFQVTLVNNLELYGVNIIKFSKECQHGVAASTTINDIPNAQNRQVQIQGSQIPFVYKLLTGKFIIFISL